METGESGCFDGGLLPSDLGGGGGAYETDGLPPYPFGSGLKVQVSILICQPQPEWLGRMQRQQPSSTGCLLPKTNAYPFFPRNESLGMRLLCVVMSRTSGLIKSVPETVDCSCWENLSF